MVVVSVLSGLAEAALLTAIAAMATALAEQRTTLSLEVLGAEFSIPMTTALIAALTLAMVRGALQLWVAYLPARMSGQAMVAIRTLLFDVFVDAEWRAKADEREGGFQGVMINHVRATAECVILFATALSTAVMFMTLVLSAVVMSPVAAALISVLSVVLFAGLRPVGKLLKKAANRLSKENIEYAKTTQEVAALAEETQVFGATTAYRARFYDQLRAVQIPFQRVRFLSAAAPGLYQSVALVVLVVALGFVAWTQPSDIATLGAVVLLLVRAVTYGQRVQGAISSIDEKMPFMNHLADAIEKYQAAPQEAGHVAMQRIDRLEMVDVHYAYEPGHDIAKGLSFSVSTGEIIGIVGPSGAGKSTLVQLLLRLRRPSSGQYLANDRPARDVRAEDWRSLVTYVPQVPKLSFGTIRENIRYFRDGITDEQIERAARRAFLHDEILALPDGYDTVVGSRSTSLSGGQRQRLCLARALVLEPTVVVLDEPTSALDVKSEVAVQESLRELAGRSIVFLVAHRLSTLTICDRVMVVNGGRVEAIGPIEELRQVNAYFDEVSAISSGENKNVAQTGGEDSS